MQSQFGNKSKQPLSLFSAFSTDEFKVENQGFQTGNCLKFDSSTNEPTPENSEENDSKLEDDCPESGVPVLKKRYTFKKERVFANIQSKNLPVISRNQHSYSLNKSVVAFNQKSNISLLIIDEQKQENFLQKAIRARNQIFSSCSFFRDPSNSLLAYSSTAGPVRIFDSDSQKVIMTINLQTDFLEAFSSSIGFVEETEQKISIFDIRFSQIAAGLKIKESLSGKMSFGLERIQNHLIFSNSSGVYYTDLRKGNVLTDIRDLEKEQKDGMSQCDKLLTSAMSFKKNKKEENQIIRISHLGNDKLLLVDMSSSVLTINELSTFKVVHSNQSTASIIDYSVSLLLENIVLLCSSDFGGMRKVFIFNFELKLLSEFCPAKVGFNMIGCFGNEHHFLVNDSENFTVFKMV